MTQFAYLPSPKPKGGRTKYFKVCPCGKEFQVKPCHYLNTSRKYCSRQCQHKYLDNGKRATIKRFNCDLCGKEFERTLGQWNRGEKTYCGNECAKKSKRNGEYRNCPNCGKQFYTSQARNKRYCSKRCDSIINPRLGFIGGADNKGENNGMFKHGRYSRKGKDSNYQKRKVREQVIECDKDGCLLCGKPGPGLHLHRVIYGSQCGRYEVDNCIQLCNEDHALVHSNKKKWQPILKEYLAERTPFMRNVLIRMKERLMENASTR